MFADIIGCISVLWNWDTIFRDVGKNMYSTTMSDEVKIIAKQLRSLYTFSMWYNSVPVCLW